MTVNSKTSLSDNILRHDIKTAMIIKSLKTAMLGVMVSFAISSVSFAGRIEDACLASNRSAANSGLCGCIQKAADMTLGGSDQRMAAKLMNDPDQAHEVWTSKDRSDDAFWDRYQSFAQMAQAYCGR